jgi:hypothetical protein
MCGTYGTVKQATDDNITRRRPFTCWLSKATHTNTRTHTHSEYVAPIAFPWQQQLRERASMLRYTYIACLVACFLLGNSPASEFYMPTFRNTLSVHSSAERYELFLLRLSRNNQQDATL